MKVGDLACRSELVHRAGVTGISLRGPVPVAVCPLDGGRAGIAPIDSSGEKVEVCRASAWRYEEDAAERTSPGDPIIVGSAVEIAVGAECETADGKPTLGLIFRKAVDQGKYSRGADLEYCAPIDFHRCSTAFRGAVHVPITPLRHNTRVSGVAPIARGSP